MKLTKLLALVAATALVATLSTPAKALTTGGFIEKAAVGNLFEIQSSQLALERSQDPGIRSFANRMVQDHSQAYDELQNVVGNGGEEGWHGRYGYRDSERPWMRDRMHDRWNRDRDVVPDNLDPKHARIVDDLERASGHRFDRMYLKAQREAHHEAGAVFASYATNGTDPALRDYAARTLPVIREHQQHLRMFR